MQPPTGYGHHCPPQRERLVQTVPDQGSAYDEVVHLEVALGLRPLGTRGWLGTPLAPWAPLREVPGWSLRYPGSECSVLVVPLRAERRKPKNGSVVVTMLVVPMVIFFREYNSSWLEA